VTGLIHRQKAYTARRPVSRTCRAELRGARWRSRRRASTRQARSNVARNPCSHGEPQSSPGRFLTNVSPAQNELGSRCPGQNHGSLRTAGTRGRRRSRQEGPPPRSKAWTAATSPRGLRVDDDVTAEQHPADHLPGDWDATWRLAELLAERGELDGPCRYCAPKPTPATGTPPGGWPSC